MVESIVKSVNIPVTVKTRIGWDDNSINILEIAKRIEDAGAAAITVHCRTRCQGHSGDPDWEWIKKVKDVVKIPVGLNGGIFTAEDAIRAFDTTNADAVMIARGAIDHPWIFKETKDLLNGKTIIPVTPLERITTALRHLRYSLEIRDVRGAIIPFRKYYTGYLKGLPNAKEVRAELYKQLEYAPIEGILMKYLEELNKPQELKWN
jgi:tRNA-dihydrouridine synthase B